MKNEHLRLYPGDKVQVIEDAYDNEDFWVALCATTGSIGTIISFDEYNIFIRTHHGGRAHPEHVYSKHLSFVAQQMKRCERYPVRFESVVPPADAVREHWANQGDEIIVLCEEGGVSLLSASFLARV